MLMRTIMRLFALLTFLAIAALTGCDKGPGAATIPPTCAGTGTVYVFTARNGWGTDVFHASLNEFIAQHPEQKVVSITPLDKDGNSSPVRYMVITTGADGRPLPPPPITEPSSTSTIPQPVEK